MKYTDQEFAYAIEIAKIKLMYLPENNPISGEADHIERFNHYLMDALSHLPEFVKNFRNE